MTQLTPRIAAYLIALSVLLISCAQLLFRYVMQYLDISGGIFVGGVDGPLAALTAGDVALLALGVLLYTSSMLCWIFALSRFEVSLAYPLLSISYILVYVGAVFLPGLGESASLSKLLGIAVIALGVAAISAGERRAPGPANTISS